MRQLWPSAALLFLLASIVSPASVSSGRFPPGGRYKVDYRNLAGEQAFPLAPVPDTARVEFREESGKILWKLDLALVRGHREAKGSGSAIILRRQGGAAGTV